MGVRVAGGFHGLRVLQFTHSNGSLPSCRDMAKRESLASVQAIGTPTTTGSVNANLGRQSLIPPHSERLHAGAKSRYVELRHAELEVGALPPELGRRTVRAVRTHPVRGPVVIRQPFAGCR